MRSKKEIVRIRKIVKEYDRDKQRLIKELKLLIKEGQREGNVVLTGGELLRTFLCILRSAGYGRHADKCTEGC